MSKIEDNRSDNYTPDHKYRSGYDEEFRGLSSKKRIDTLSRVHLLSDLEATDPLIRLQLLCERGLYRTTFNWDQFQDCIMMSCELTYFVNGKEVQLLKRSSTLPGHSTQMAKRMLAEIILSELGIKLANNFATGIANNFATCVAEQKKQQKNESPYTKPDAKVDPMIEIQSQLHTILSAVSNLAADKRETDKKSDTRASNE